MTQYRRICKKGGCYFFTVALNNRHQTLLTDNITLLRQAFYTIKKKYPFTINAIVIMPNHLHCIWTLPQDDDDYSLRWRLIKTLFSKQLPATELRSNSRRLKKERGIWQRRFWEHLIENEKDLNERINYIHFNPVKHGYCSSAKDWPYSSFHRFSD